MTDKSTLALELYAKGAWRSLKALGKTIEDNSFKNLSASQAFLLRGICESPLQANYSPELTERLRKENPIAALGLLISRASLAHAIAKLITDDIYSAKEYIQSSLAALLTTFDLVGLNICSQKKQHILRGAAGLSNCLHSQVRLKQTLLQKKLSNRLTFVLGMHRSGTSALTGMLAHAGFSAPKGLMPATKNNTKGYWESVSIMRANENILEALSSHWSATVKLPTDWAYTEQARLWREELLNCFLEDFGDSFHPIIKDPRFCILMEGLRPWLESDLIDPSFIIAIRDPSEVAQSLKKAEKVCISRGLSLWIVYSLKAINESQEYERRIVDYHRLLENPSTVLISCSEMLTPASSNETALADPTDYIEPGMRHEDTQSLDSEEAAINEENVEELHKLAQEIHATIINETPEPAMLAESLRRLEQRYVAFNI